MLRFWKHLIDNHGPEPFMYGNGSLAEYAFEIGSISDTGRVRSINQDNIGIVNFPDSKNLLVIVADGMGGHQGGEIASRIAVETIQREFSKLLDKHNGFHALKKVFLEANNAIFHRSKKSPELTGMGTTLVAMALLNGRVYYANTGDSRLYRIRDGQCTQLSEDHTLVNEMVNMGLLEPEAAENHPDKHVITRAIGTHAKIQVDVPESPLDIEIGDCFLLCSDGLYDLVEEAEMVDLIAGNSPQQTCKRLVDLANSRGGYDNISIIIIKILKTARGSGEAPVTRY